MSTNLFFAFFWFILVVINLVLGYRKKQKGQDLENQVMLAFICAFTGILNLIQLIK